MNHASGPDSGDPRAYEVDSGEIALGVALQRAEIRVPDCMQDGIRFALINDGFNYHYKIYLRVELAEPCLSDFIEGNRMKNLEQQSKIGGADDERVLSYRPRWMSDDIIGKMGWDIGPEQRFQQFKVTTAASYPVVGLVQHVQGSTSIRAYVYAFHGG